MRDRLIFLDIDGVLNSNAIEHVSLLSDPFGWTVVPQILPKCVRNLNAIVGSTEAKLVLSSAWRYSILNGDMTLRGFESLLRSHGVRGTLLGHTRLDRDDEPRWMQIRDWLREKTPSANYCILDDDPDAFGGRPGVQTNGNGLTEADARRAIEILTEGT